MPEGGRRHRLVRRRLDGGAATLEYVGIAVVVAMLVAAIGTALLSASPEMTRGLTCAVQSVLGQGEACAEAARDDGPDDAPDDVPLDPRAEAVLIDLDRLDGFAGSGEATRELDQQVRDALAVGDLDLAELLVQRLAVYDDLVASGPRGELFRDLLGASDTEYAELMAAGNMYFDGSRYNTAYFQLEDPPGGGVVVMDYFIDSGSSGLVLAGDDRDHEDPVRGDLALEESRMMLVVDLGTGRGQVYVTETCTSGIRVCNEPRPNVFDGSFLSNDTGTRPVIPLLDNDYDVANQFSFSPVDGGFRLEYDALNGIIPTGSVDGTVSVSVGPDGRLVIGEDDRDNYPSIGTYYYASPGQTQVVQQREQESVVCGALPINIC